MTAVSWSDCKEKNGRPVLREDVRITLACRTISDRAYDCPLISDHKKPCRLCPGFNGAQARLHAAPAVWTHRVGELSRGLNVTVGNRVEFADLCQTNHVSLSYS